MINLIPAIIIISGIVFNAGVAYGIVKVSLKTLNEKMDKMQEQLNTIGDADKIARSYLFQPDGTPRYISVQGCMRSHDDLKERFNKFEDKLDAVLNAIRK